MAVPGRRVLASAARQLADALLPQRCIACARFGAALHEACARALPRADGARCVICWRPGAGSPCPSCAATATQALDELRAAFRFDGFARRAILEAKFGGVAALLSPLARVAAESVPDHWSVDAIVPVPLGPRRRRRRGFNQAEVIARVVAGALELGVAADAVRRVRETRPQSSLDAQMRASNLDGAFAAPRGAPRGVLLIDDVTTTGTTLAAVARVVRAAGAERVYALALARED